jgi:hypothetical protein
VKFSPLSQVRNDSNGGGGVSASSGSYGGRGPTKRR